MNSKVTENLRLQLKYDKINSKYNRLWEQVTNISLFILAAFVAYSIAYVEFEAGWTIFLSKLTIPIILIIIIVTIPFSILLFLLIQTAIQLHKLLGNYNLLD